MCSKCTSTSLIESLPFTAGKGADTKKEEEKEKGQEVSREAIP
jgi:hypothetical protein